MNSPLPSPFLHILLSLNKNKSSILLVAVSVITVLSAAPFVRGLSVRTFNVHVPGGLDTNKRIALGYQADEVTSKNEALLRSACNCFLEFVQEFDAQSHLLRVI